MIKPIVAIVGRPNVGKSTLFNRLIGDKKAIIEDSPGTTRDLIYADTSWKGFEFTLVDSGGLELKPDTNVRHMVKKQVEVAIAEADVILFLVDARDGVVPADEEVVDILRRIRKPIVLVANKIDNLQQQDLAFQFYELNVGDPIAISAYHGKDTEELLDKVVEYLPPPPPVSSEAELMKIAIVGRPNVGKSTLINTLLGEERVIVDEIPGTTRDAIDTVLLHDGEKIALIDTAGMRRRGRIEQGVEQYSSIRALRAIDQSDVALLLTDAVEGITAQDIHILGHVQQAYKGAVLIINKWDIAENKEVAWWTEAVRDKTKFMPYMEILFLSAKTGDGVQEVLPAAKRVYQQRLKRISSSRLDNFVKDAIAVHPPPKKGKRQLRIIYMKQTAVNPPTFTFAVNDASLAHFTYQRFLENRLRQAFGFQGTPLRLLFKSKGERKHGV